MATIDYQIFEVDGDITSAKAWCEQVFGPAGARWFFVNKKFYFRSKKDALLFDIRW